MSDEQPQEPEPVYGQPVILTQDDGAAGAETVLTPDAGQFRISVNKQIYERAGTYGGEDGTPIYRRVPW